MICVKGLISDKKNMPLFFQLSNPSFPLLPVIPQLE